MINTQNEIMIKMATELGHVPPPPIPDFSDVKPQQTKEILDEIKEDTRSIQEPIPLPKSEYAEAEHVAKTDPRAYIKTYRYHKNPRLDHITEQMMIEMVDKKPEQFFDIGLNSTKYFDLKQWRPWAAMGVVDKDPLLALERYKIHRDRVILDELAAKGLLNPFFKNFWNSLMDKVDKQRLLSEKKFANEVRYLARMIALNYPEYYLEEVSEDPMFSGYKNFARRALKEKPLQGE
jgi:hypothetical protein